MIFLAVAWGVSFAPFGEWVILLGGVVGALAVIHTKVVKPVVSFSRKLAETLERGVKVIEWVERDFGPTLELLKSLSRRVETLEDLAAALQRRQEEDKWE